MDAEGSPPARPAPSGALQGLIDEMLGHGRASAGGPPPAALKKLAAGAEAALGRVLRDAMLHPPFRRLEASWRGLRYFVRSLDFRASCRVRVVPASAGGLLRAAKEIALPLADEIHSQGRLVCLLIDFALEPSEETAGLARAAAAHSVPAITSVALARPIEETAARWAAGAAALAGTGDARWLAPVANSFLLRAPYGAKTDPVGEFPFEETGPGLWGLPGWLLGAMVSAAVVRTGWGVDFAGRAAAESLESLPARPAEIRPGEWIQIPLEEDLGESDARALDEAGIIPLVCRRNSDRAFAAGGGRLREALFAAQVSATMESLMPNIDPTRSPSEIARTIGAGLELMGLTERGPELAVEAGAAEAPPRILLRVRPVGPRLRGLPELNLEVPIPLR